MVRSLAEFLARLWTCWWGLLSGAAGLIVAFCWDVAAIPPDIGWWPKWAIGATLALLGASFQAFHAVRLERDMRPPDPSVIPRDWSIVDALWYLASRQLEPTGSALAQVLNDVRQAARDGVVTIWGRPIYQYDPSTPVVPIPKEYWDAYMLDSVACLLWDEGDVPKGKTSAALIDRDNKKIYGDLGVNKKQIIRKWGRNLHWFKHRYVNRWRGFSDVKTR